mmetsp:Transcript_136522/g.254963  ORF Transcript_136522/g.254963 Transcript_136522/m.254963 type:complete len:212 (+) Transcript_136522:355-990(+)
MNAALLTRGATKTLYLTGLCKFTVTVSTACIAPLLTWPGLTLSTGTGTVFKTMTLWTPGWRSEASIGAGVLLQLPDASHSFACSRCPEVITCSVPSCRQIVTHPSNREVPIFTFSTPTKSVDSVTWSKHNILSPGLTSLRNCKCCPCSTQTSVSIGRQSPEIRTVLRTVLASTSAAYIAPDAWQASAEMDGCPSLAMACREYTSQLRGLAP